MAGSAPLGDGRPAWGTDGDGPSRLGCRRTWSGRRFPAASPVTGALPGRPRLPRPPRNVGRRSWHPHDRQFLVPAASYLARMSTPTASRAARTCCAYLGISQSHARTLGRISRRPAAVAASTTSSPGPRPSPLPLLYRRFPPHLATCRCLSSFKIHSPSPSAPTPAKQEADVVLPAASLRWRRRSCTPRRWRFRSRITALDLDPMDSSQSFVDMLTKKIMFCNTSNMDESQRAYVKATRQQIATVKEALVKASGGGSTSEQGSGGDAEEAESLM